jgi:transposase
MVPMTVYIGIDWSEQKHDVCFQNEKGDVIQIIKIDQSPEGFVKLDECRRHIGITAQDCVVGIETSHNLLIDYLLDQNYRAVYVLPPNAVKSSQGIFRQSGSKSDRNDAILIADMIRLAAYRFHAWVPDTPLTQKIRVQVRLIGFLTKQIIQTGNRLRAALLRYYPTALVLFSSTDTPILLEWLIKYPTPELAETVTFDDFKLFLKEHRHPQPKKWAECYARLQLPQVKASPGNTIAFAAEARLLASLMLELIHGRNSLLKELKKDFVNHPDFAIYHSLPAAGDFLQPALCAMLGDDRQRFATAQVLQAIAGTCPVTEQSGKSKFVHFRYACDHQFRHVVQQWAKCSVQSSPWAAGYFKAVRPRCRTENDAYRRLANRWLEVLWRLWQDRVPYDEQKHLKAHALRLKPKN